MGRSVTAEDILNRFCECNALSADHETALYLLSRYLAALQEYKIGNVLSITYTKDNAFHLTKVLDLPPPLFQPHLS